MNQLILQYIDEHAPLKKIKLTRPPAPWKKSGTITKLKAKQDQLRKKVFYSQNNTDILSYRQKRSLLKKSIKPEKAKFYKTALCSGKTKIVWKTIHNTLKPNPKAITASPDYLNNFFSNIAENLTRKISCKSSYKRQTYRIRLTIYAYWKRFILMTYKNKLKALEAIVPQALMVFLLLLINRCRISLVIIYA